MAHGLSCSVACGIFPGQGSNPCPLHWQADSQPLRHQGSPNNMGLNCMGPLTCGFLSLNIYYSTTRSQGWLNPVSTDVELWVPIVKLHTSFSVCGFFTTWILDCAVGLVTLTPLLFKGQLYLQRRDSAFHEGMLSVN